MFTGRPATVQQFSKYH